MINIENKSNKIAAAVRRLGADRRRKPRPQSDITELEKTNIRLSAELKSKFLTLAIALVVMATVAVTTITAILPLIGQQQAQRMRPPATTGPRN